MELFKELMKILSHCETIFMFTVVILCLQKILFAGGMHMWVAYMICDAYAYVMHILEEYWPEYVWIENL